MKMNKKVLLGATVLIAALAPISAYAATGSFIGGQGKATKTVASATVAPGAVVADKEETLVYAGVTPVSKEDLGKIDLTIGAKLSQGALSRNLEVNKDSDGKKEQTISATAQSSKPIQEVKEEKISFNSGPILVSKEDLGKVDLTRGAKLSQGTLVQNVEEKKARGKAISVEGSDGKSEHTISSSAQLTEPIQAVEKTSFSLAGAIPVGNEQGNQDSVEKKEQTSSATVSSGTAVQEGPGEITVSSNLIPISANAPLPQGSSTSLVIGLSEDHSSKEDLTQMIDKIKKDTSVMGITDIIVNYHTKSGQQEFLKISLKKSTAEIVALIQG